MPTGYTAYIEDGEITTGKEFIMKCARAFGACIDMKEESLSAQIPEKFEPSDYYTRNLERAKRELEKYQNISEEDTKKEIDYQYEISVKQAKEGLEKQQKINSIYDEIECQVEGWQPPTKEHIELKNFALEQIRISKSDNLSWYEKEISKPKPDAKEMIKNRIFQCEEDIKYYEEKVKDEEVRYSKRNLWIKQLRDSLNTN